MSLKNLNQNIQKLFKEWQSVQPLDTKYQEILNHKIRLDWNYHSNRIEGNTLTYGETELLLKFGRMEGGHLERDYMEMKAHDIAIKMIYEWSRQSQFLTEGDIRDLNKVILKEPFFKEAQTPEGKKTTKQIIPGEYKKQQNHVKTATGEIFKFAEPEDVPIKMQEFIKWLKTELENPTLPVAEMLAKLYHDFILIHPFDDGNGRIVRLLLNYALLKLSYPPMVIQSSDRENYLIALNKADTGDKNALSLYLGNVLVKWLETGIRASKGEDISEPENTKIDISTKNTVPALSNINIDYLNRCITALEDAYKEMQTHTSETSSYEVYRAACVKEFEIILEQCGKLLTKRLHGFFTANQEVDKLTFKDKFRYATKHGLIDVKSSERWLNYRDVRNDTAHEYGKNFAEEVLDLLSQFIIDAKALSCVLVEDQNER